MADLTLEVSKREGTGTGVARKLRAKNRVPAVVYGGHKEAVSIDVDRKTMSELISKSEHGIRSIFLLKMAGTDQQRHVMVKDIQINPVSRKMIHIDFVRVNMDEKVKVTIPIHLTGTAVGVKTGGGLLDFQARELHVECLPNAIPDTIDVDVTNLNLHEYIRVSDLTLPNGVKVLDDPDRVVASVHHAKVEAEPVAEAGVAEPEIIKKGKAEEDAEKK
jgi:large subunit ribosomal protein L25